MEVLDSAFIKAAAMQVGFDACGIAAAHSINPQDWPLLYAIRKRYYADMRYMYEHVDMRLDPTLLVPGAKSIISVLLGYRPSARIPGIAQYAYGPDYHETVKQRLFQLIGIIKERYPDFDAKPCVDTVPISDKYWAVQAGLGWIGKNTLLINPTLGSYCFIGELVTTSEADAYDAPIENRCNDCERCLNACPNHALGKIEPDTDDYIQNSGPQYVLNSQKCASYHTIENRSETLPEDIKLSGYYFGCDCCQLACPYNQQARVKMDLSDQRLKELSELIDADEATFKHSTKHSAINRVKHWQWLRNIRHK